MPACDLCHLVLEKVLGEALHILNRDGFEDLNLPVKPLAIAIDQPVLECGCEGVRGSGIGGNVDCSTTRPR